MRVIQQSLFSFAIVCAIPVTAQIAEEAAPPAFRLGDKLTLNGQKSFLQRIDDGERLLVPPPKPNAELGAYITPVDATASASQSGAGRTPQKLIDGSGWGESFPGSGVYVHGNNVYEGGSSMWNGMHPKGFPWLQFDLGRTYRVAGVYVWNYNETDWSNRSVKGVLISSSLDGKIFKPVGEFAFERAPGREDYAGQAVPFQTPVQARHFKFEIRSNYRGGEMAGLAEIRFANADEKAPPPQRVVWQPKYLRPQHPKLRLGATLPSRPNIAFPTDAGVVDVTQAPYFAKGDGVTDDTQAIQRALDDYPSKHAIIYLPNGTYRVSDTLRWAKNEKNTVLWGQSREGAVIQLRDNCPGYENPRRPKAVIWTGKAPAQRFSNEMHSLTVDTGTGNPGACGVQFIANNQGGMWEVTIVSGDGQGVSGLDLGYTDEQGPCLIKNVRVRGFDYGVKTATSVASETLEHVTVEHQNKAGFRNDGQPLTARGLRSLNAVPALLAMGGLTVLVDCEFQGTGDAQRQPAVIVEGALLARDIRTQGYARAIENRSGHKTGVDGPNVDLFLTKPAASLFGEAGTSLRLPIKEMPQIPWDELTRWKAPQAFGGVADDRRDDSRAIQQAIDSGASTVYLPRGSYSIGETIVIRGQVHRLIGCRAHLDVMDSLRRAGQPVFRVEDDGPSAVIVEGLSTDFAGGKHCFVENHAQRTLVLHRLAINFQGADGYRGRGSGEVYIEDVVGHNFRFQGQQLWARQFNVEGGGTHITNDGGTHWILGFKTEGGGTLLETSHGGVTELLGGLAYSSGQGLTTPMFAVDHARAAFTFSEVDFGGGHFATIVRETRDGQTRELTAEDPRWNRHVTLFTAGK